MAFKDILREKKKELCLSMRGLAIKLDVDFNTIQRWEKGMLPRSENNMAKIKKFLGDDIEKVIEEERKINKVKTNKKISKIKKSQYANKSNEFEEIKDDFEKLAKKEKCENGNCLLNCEGKYCRSPIRVYNPDKFTCKGRNKIVKETNENKKIRAILIDKNRCNVRI